ncbi:MAG TPA: OmpA family protein, partial [Bryobacteraceae bacterium]|nr:OmpA family protein [Bryobacteraceae bacterium]
AAKMARSADTRVRPVESRAGKLEARATATEGRADQLESRAGEIEKRSTVLEGKQQETAQQVVAVKETATQAGDAAHQANTGVAKLGDRVTNLDEYEPKTSATVLFAVNSARLTPAGKADLDGLISQLANEKGYMVEVAGFADTTGNPDRNQVLSEQRASSVVRYLQEEGNVPLRRILAPAGLGTSHAAADNKSPDGRKQNRRVEVRILVNRGITGSASPETSSNAMPSRSGDAGRGDNERAGK